MKLINQTFLLFLIAAILGCHNPNTPQSVEEKSAPTIEEIIPEAVIYEVNIRQYTPEGTLNAFTEHHLDRLADLGVDILWLMPVYPISEKNRKGDLGSYYAVADYKAVNPEFGTLEDLQLLVDKAHKKGMLVILDWVANHTGWDNWWIEEHPDWYTHNEAGEIIAPVADWTDVADLNYDVPEMQDAMIDALQYWVVNADVDGYRCDVAGMVPVSFWNKARVALDSIKPVFMLAEAHEAALLESAFDMVYGWDLHHTMNRVAQGKAGAEAVIDQVDSINKKYAADDILMQFITNHDENSWNGTAYERMGDARACMAVLSYIIPGMPLIYSGQEANLDKRLRFFSKDTIFWSDTSQFGFYHKLNELKKNPALSSYDKLSENDIVIDNEKQLLIINRHNETHQVISIFNLSDNPQVLSKKAFSTFPDGDYQDLFSGDIINAGTYIPDELAPWGYSVFVKQ